MTYARLCILPLLLTALAPACVIELDALEDLGALGRCHRGDPKIEHYTIDEPIRAVVVDGGVGDLHVHGHAEAGVVIDAALFGSREQPEPHLRVDDGVLYVTTQCDTGCCEADLTLAIPSAASLEIDHGVGNVTVTELEGTVDVDLGTGDIQLDELAGALGLGTGTGRIQGHGLRGASAWADVGTGDVTLIYDPAAAPAAIGVDVGVGAVDLRVPEGAYDLQLSTGVGDVSVSNLHDDRDAGRRIAVDVGTGEIEVRGL